MCIVLSKQKALAMVKEKGITPTVNLLSLIAKADHGVAVADGSVWGLMPESSTIDQRVLVDKYGKGKKDGESPADGVRWKFGRTTFGFTADKKQKKVINHDSSSTGWQVWVNVSTCGTCGYWATP